MSNEMKWTKGSWFACDPGMDGELVVSVSLEWSVKSDATPSPNASYDAHLIAAAPDGYALAELVMDYCGNPKGMSDQQRDELYEVALQFAKKARGEQS